MTQHASVKSKTITTIAAVVAAVFATGLPAQASDDDCRMVPKAEWRTSADAIAAVQAKGYDVREFEIDDGCYEFNVVGKSGERVKLYLDPGTLEIVRTKNRS